MSDLVKIYQSANATQFMLARGLLEEAGIEVLAKNFEERNMFGYGSMGAGYNILVGQFELHVLDSNAAEAREVLIESGMFEAHSPEASIDDPNPNSMTIARWMMAGFIAVLVGVGFGGPLIGAIAVFIYTVYFAVMFMLGGPARRRLLELGYEWVGRHDAIEIRMRLGANFHRLPTAAELETIPGFRQTAASLVEHYHQFRKHHPAPGHPES
jgi:hypothetical protein